MAKLAPYWKTITALVGGAVTVAVNAIVNGDVQTWVTSIVPLLTALGVYQVKNQPKG